MVKKSPGYLLEIISVGLIDTLTSLLSVSSSSVNKLPMQLRERDSSFHLNGLVTLFGLLLYGNAYLIIAVVDVDCYDIDVTLQVTGSSV